MPRSPVFRPALVALAAAAACPAFAQADGFVAETIQITGRKNPDASTLTQPDLPSARRDIERTPGGAAVVDARGYAEGRVATLSDAIGTATGVYVQPRFGAEEARISIRGSGLQRTYHGRGLKLMQDGVPLNLADGSFDFQAVEALSARYVEVWRGANALRYGAGNLGGAVNFVSPNGYNAERLRARFESGSDGYRRAQLSGGEVFGEFDGYVSASVFRQDGFRDHAAQDTRRSFANLGWQLGPQLETRFYVGRVDSDSELPGAITKAQLTRDPRAANPGNVTGDQHRDIGWTRVSNRTAWRVDAEQRVEFFAYASDKHLHHPIFQVLEQDNDDLGAELRYRFDGTLGGQPHRVTLGVAPLRGRTDEDRFVNAGGERGARTNASRQRARSVEVYAEDEWRFAPDWTLVTGAQWARATRELDDRYVAGTPSDPVDESFSLRYRGWSPKIGLVRQLAADAQAFANLSRSFEPPSFGELAGGRWPTPNDAQRATTLEFGTRGRDDGLEWDLAVYWTRVRDELLQIATNDAGASVTVNAPHTIHRGLEAGLGGRAFASAAGHAEWRASLLFNDFRFDGDPVYGDRQLPGLPKRAARGQLGWRFGDGLLVQGSVEAAGGYPIDFANCFDAAGYAVLGLRVAGRLGDVDWFVDGRNLGDRRYAATTGVVRDARGADAAQFYPGDGRSVFFGIDWKLP